ncbi:MAG: 23S rRNA (adenine(2503)-C(2))-methyltransferase RlmN [Tannerella sp.]|jgi:23S rRNA (adenine2503-C2)-methyltransferase|nr:23S rRNA (adenine(2503)-C(2))-methyltransferase RlmN [Tannerella sp.]
MDTDNRKIHLLGMTLDELKTVAADAGLPSYGALQLADWLYRKKATSVDEMTNIAKAKRLLLDASCEVGAFPPAGEMKSADGTVKYLFRISSDRAVETVYIPDNERATLCVSSQAGCRMNCLFCMTGKQGFAANLTAGEIINQIQSVPEAKQLTNVVFMGMGEPFDNTDELFKALEIMTSDYGYGWSPKRITVSTVGIMKGLRRFLEESACHLAVSLHSPYPDERQSLIPAEKAYPATEIIRLLRQYDFSHQRRVSFEYIMFENKNDSPKHADALARLLNRLECRVNLIRFHAAPGVPLRSSSLQKMEQFRDALNARRIMCTIRASRGEDILAACGMLSTDKKNTGRKQSLFPYNEVYL